MDKYVEGRIMWFNIIKDTEDDRLRALGYPVPKKPKSTVLTRDRIIDTIKDWADNTPEISPFDEYFTIVRSNTIVIPAQTTAALVVEPSGSNSMWFEQFTTRTAYGTEGPYKVRREGGMMNDTYIGKFYVNIYEIGNTKPIIGHNLQRRLNIDEPVRPVIAITTQEDLDYFIRKIEEHLPKIRGGGFYASMEKELVNAGHDVKISGSGLLWMTGPSGTQYKVDFSSGDCNITAVNKEITFRDYPELNTKLNVAMCVHANRTIPLGDRYAQAVMGIKHDTMNSEQIPAVFRLFGKEWNIRQSRYEKTFLQNKLKEPKKHITEGHAVTLLQMPDNSDDLTVVPW